jgi:hypothetical protein
MKPCLILILLLAVEVFPQQPAATSEKELKRPRTITLNKSFNPSTVTLEWRSYYAIKA